MGEALVDGAQPFVDAVRAGEHLGEQREEGRADEAGPDRLLDGEAVLQLVDALVRVRPSAASATPWNERPHSVSCFSSYSRQSATISSPMLDRLVRLAAIEVDALRDDEREGEGHRLALRSRQRQRFARALGRRDPG